MQKYLIQDFNTPINIYGSHHKIEIPYYMEKSKAQKIAIQPDGILNNSYIVAAGTPIPSTEDPKGLLANDCDVTNNDLVGAICVHGVVLKEKLPKKYLLVVQSKLKGIIFLEKNIDVPIVIEPLFGTIEISRSQVVETGKKYFYVGVKVKNTNFWRANDWAKLIKEKYLGFKELTGAQIDESLIIEQNKWFLYNNILFLSCYATTDITVGKYYYFYISSECLTKGIDSVSTIPFVRIIN